MKKILNFQIARDVQMAKSHYGNLLMCNIQDFLFLLYLCFFYFPSKHVLWVHVVRTALPRWF